MALTFIPAHEAKKLVDKGITIVDIRTIDEFNNEHIPHALNIPADELDCAELSQPVLFHCRSGKRTRQSAYLLEAASPNGYVMDDGIEGWKKANFPIKSGVE